MRLCEEIDAQLDAHGLEDAFQTAKQEQVNAIMTTALRVFFAERKRIVELAGKYQLPAGYLDKILRGAKPADLPVQQATKFEFVVILKAAKQIDLTIPTEFLNGRMTLSSSNDQFKIVTQIGHRIPPNVLARADKVIK